MTISEKKQLMATACKVRMGIIEGTHGAKAGHPGGSLSAAEAFTYLYFKEMNIDPKNPKWADRDRFVLSKGHTAPGLYAALANRGFFPVEDLPTLRHIDSYLQGHPNMNTVPGVDMSTGSLGQGISAAAGMALAAKHQGKANRVYTLLGDGEIQEGQVWEAMMFAAHYNLDNFCAIIDNNGLQIDGKVADVRFRGRRYRRSRLRAAGSRLRPGSRHQGQALRHHHADHQGQGRQLHGEPGRLARQGSQRRGIRSGYGRTEGSAGRSGGDVKWQM